MDKYSHIHLGFMAKKNQHGDTQRHMMQSHDTYIHAKMAATVFWSHDTYHIQPNIGSQYLVLLILCKEILQSSKFTTANLLNKKEEKVKVFAQFVMRFTKNSFYFQLIVVKYVLKVNKVYVLLFL